MACANPECGCEEERVRSKGRGYCGEGCVEEAERNVRGHSQHAPAAERSARHCGCGHAGCH